MRLPIGVWWLLDSDFVGQCLRSSGYENAECSFEERFVRPGMTVLDIGAHRGFHTLLLSSKVGKRGHVLSFEPSPSDLKRLNLHLRINLCRNVKVYDYALGEEDGSANLYVVQVNTVLNSLRPPDTVLQASPTPVVVRKLDNVLSQAQIGNVDFIKLDVEGGELGVLKGAEQMLQKVPRPVILCEVMEQRTRPWGYPSRLIVEHLSRRRFVWFELNACGEPLPVPNGRSELIGNFVAVPKESLETFEHLRGPSTAVPPPRASRDKEARASAQ